MVTQNDKLKYLIDYLLKESNLKEKIPSDELSQKKLYRTLTNIRLPKPIKEEFIKVQDEYLQEELQKKEIKDAQDLLSIKPNIYLWKGDITTLKCDAIVNAANSQMLGCFQPLHNCIDNAIHSAAGIQVRLDCNEIMKGRKAENGEVIITSAYNLPSKYIFHTVGPIVYNKVTNQNKEDLKKCYLNCLKIADELKLTSIAFCCIATGVFGYPQEDAAHLAYQTVNTYLQEGQSKLKVIFNVFTEVDYEIYKRILT